MTGVELNKMIQELNLYNKTPEIDTSGKRINTPEINRPALQLTGYLEHFENEREYSLPLAFPFTGCWWTYTGKAF